jgi:hypothetical protein
LKIKAFLKFSLSRALFSKLQLLEARSGGIACINHKGIISGMDVVEGALALQNFTQNAKYVEMIVDLAFAVVPSVLGIGAAGLIGRAVVQTAREVIRSVSLLGTLGKLKWAVRGGGTNPPTPAPVAPAAPAAAAAVAMAGRENPEITYTFPITIVPPTIKKDKGEGKENTSGQGG